jgi:phosphoribosylformylglycinamidine cyclo-ligase
MRPKVWRFNRDAPHTQGSIMKYEDSGVNIDRANRAKQAIGRHVRSTWGDAVLSETGAFGGLFAVPGGVEDPVLVSSIDGVGTKLLVAAMGDRYDTVGQDLVNHCVNDILVQGARPLFFLDYIAAGSLEPDRVGAIVEGLAKACRENSCALIGGETAEMPGVYKGDDFDMAGAIVGVVGKSEIIDGSTIKSGDIVFGLPSSGLHTNGYSLARKIFFEEMGLGAGDRVEALGCTVGEELLRVHRSYLVSVQSIMESVTVKGLAHITGGGVVENLPRILPENCGARIEKGTWPMLPVFSWMAEHGKVEEAEMFRVFNMGLGMLVILSADDAEKVASAEGVYRVGEIVSGTREVEVV